MFCAVLPFAVLPLLPAMLPLMAWGLAGPPHPANLLHQLPSLRLPYVAGLRAPSNVPPLSPSPTTRVVSLVTAYVYRNPVCVRAASRRRRMALCGARGDPQDTRGTERLVTKEYYVNDVRHWAPQKAGGEHRRPSLDADDRFALSSRQARRLDDPGLYIEASEQERSNAGPAASPTPALGPKTSAQVEALLIEEGLDRLEALLPSYTRKHIYQTSTITVTRVRSNRRATATLLAKNCIPQGYDLCPVRLKKRKAKVDERLFGLNSTFI